MKLFSRRTAVAALALAVGLVAGTAAGGVATNHQLPADKTAVAGAALVDIGPAEEHPILQQRMKVSSPADLILGVTLECSILTRLVTNNDTPSSATTGSVDIRITVDGKNVPVQTAGEGAEGDDGSVTFCNRTYQRTVTDEEDPLDGIDAEDDYIQTKSANGFNWLALNVGNDATYDDPANGNNILDIVVFARYDRTHEAGTCVGADPATSCSEAYVGKRTLIIEPVHAANGEESEPAGASTSGGGGSSSSFLGL